MLVVSLASAGTPIPKEFHGDWVPAAGTCDSPARFRVSEDKVTLIQGKDSASFGDIAIPTSYFGPDYTGPSVVVIPEFESGNSPFTVYFNVDDKMGVAQLDIYEPISGPKNPQIEAIQAPSKALAKRFPLHRVALKHCPASAG